MTLNIKIAIRIELKLQKRSNLKKMSAIKSIGAICHSDPNAVRTYKFDFENQNCC